MNQDTHFCEDYATKLNVLVVRTGNRLEYAFDQPRPDGKCEVDTSRFLLVVGESQDMYVIAMDLLIERLNRLQKFATGKYFEPVQREG